jgi:hypothetical protein
MVERWSSGFVLERYPGVSYPVLGISVVETALLKA